MLPAIKTYRSVLWSLLFFRGSVLELPPSKWLLALSVCAYVGLSMLQAYVLHPPWSAEVVEAALLDGGFTLVFLGFFIVVRNASRWVQTLMAIQGVGVYLSVPQLALSAWTVAGDEVMALKSVLALGLLLWSAFCFARILTQGVGFHRAFALLIVLTYLMADDQLVSVLTGVTG